jgi:hypothetical protein
MGFPGQIVLPDWRLLDLSHSPPGQLRSGRPIRGTFISSFCIEWLRPVLLEA